MPATRAIRRTLGPAFAAARRSARGGRQIESGTPGLEPGTSSPPASQPGGGRSGEVAGRGLATPNRARASGLSRFRPRVGFETFGHEWAAVAVLLRHVCSGHPVGKFVLHHWPNLD
jgi:hypothetical protein